MAYSTEDGAVVLVFGQGDLLIGAGGPKDGPANEIVIWPSATGCHPIGDIDDGDVGKSTAAVQSLVRMVFSDPQSLDVLIHQMTELRADMGGVAKWVVPERAICPEPTPPSEEGETLSGDEDVGFALRYALSELRNAKPNDRSEKDRLYAIAITDLQKLTAFFEMAVILGDDGSLA
jgi:hypothetical protein